MENTSNDDLINNKKYYNFAINTIIALLLSLITIIFSILYIVLLNNEFEYKMKVIAMLVIAKSLFYLL